METDSTEGGSDAHDSLSATDDEEPMLLAALNCSYSELLSRVRQFDFEPTESSSKLLPPEICRRVIEYFIVDFVNTEQVEAVGCSSHDEVHPLSACLSDDETTWWISGERSMPWGRGNEYVELCLGPTLRRLTAVSIKIPPLPQGPLSVSEFHLEAPGSDGEWEACSPVFTLENRTGFQRFPLTEDVDAQLVRVVCLSNHFFSAVARYRDLPQEQRQLFRLNNPRERRRFENVGFFTVKIE